MVPQCYPSGASIPATVMTRITSRRSPIVARYRAAARGEPADVMLLDGPHLLTEAIASGVRLLHVTARADAVDTPEIAAVLRAAGARRTDVACASAAVMEAISPVRSSSAVAALAARPVCNLEKLFGPSALTVIACDVQDPGNLGAIVRVAEAGGASGVVAGAASADPFGWKALRGSMGSAFRLPVIQQRDVAAALSDARTRGCRILATIPRGGRSPFDIDLTTPAAVLIGGEGAGLSDAMVRAADDRITIPMRAPVESLNSAVAAAVVVYEANRQRGGMQPRT